MPGLSHALVPAQESKRWSFGRLLLLPVIQKGLFLGPKKSRKIRQRKYGPRQFKIPATDAVCVKVALSLTFCAHSSLQSFSTSDKMKGPKTGPPGGTTFDPKRSTFGFLLKFICFAQGPKLGPQHSESGTSLGLV